MQTGQKFCCECGAPLAKHEEDKALSPNDKVESYESGSLKSSTPPKKNKGVKVVVKVIVTLILMIIIAAVVNTIGRVPSYIVGGICVVIIPNVWKLIDDF